MEYVNYSLYFSLIWFCFLSYITIKSGLEEIKKGKRISIEGFWIVFFVPSIISILIEYLIRK